MYLPDQKTPPHLSPIVYDFWRSRGHEIYLLREMNCYFAGSKSNNWMICDYGGDSIEYGGLDNKWYNEEEYLRLLKLKAFL